MPRRFVRQETIAARFRDQIVDGQLPPGSRLPTRAELERKFRTSIVTVQRALAKLTEEGFVEARGRNGTFVVEHPPHRCHYALVFPSYEGHPSWGRYWTALDREAKRLPAAQHRRIVSFYNINGHVDLNDYRRLLEFYETRRLAGLIFVTPPNPLKHTPLIRQHLVPRVALMAQPEHNTSALALDQYALIDKAFEHLAARGRKRIALILAPGLQGAFEEYCLAAAARRGLEIPSYFLQIVHQSSPVSARNLLHLLMRGRPDERPDGLFITDDNLVEEASAGIAAAGVRVPEDLEIVAHCNFPWPTPSSLPMRRLGYDAREILRLAFTHLDGRRAKKDLPQVTPIPAHFEDELPAS
jgi:DNA-binding LacI/PurR family transcriptional regulator